MSLDTPPRITVPFGQDGLRDVIPAHSDDINGRAGYDLGFPPSNMKPRTAGGIPPFGQDMNGILYDITDALRYWQAGGQFLYDATFATAIGGYPKGALVQNATQTALWVNLINGNLSDPDNGGAGWLSLGEIRWKSVPTGYVASPGDHVFLNNRVDSPTLLLPPNPAYGQELQVMPWPFTKYSSYNLMVDGNGHPIMGLNEVMAVDEDNVVFACKYLGALTGWFLEKVGVSGNSYTISTYSGAAYGAASIQKFDAKVVRGAPLVMMVHGGGWIAGDRNAANLASGGYVQQFPAKYGFGFASIDYTLATPSVNSYPTAVNDVIAAAEYFKANLGASSIHILGTSAGANLAALAVIARPDLFASFIGYYGAYDLTKLSEFSADVQTDIGYYTSNPTAASPTLQAGSWTTPAILIHGDADTTVSPQQSVDFGAVIGVTPISVAGAVHAFNIFGDPAGTLPDYAKSVFKFIDGVSLK